MKTITEKQVIQLFENTSKEGKKYFKGKTEDQCYEVTLFINDKRKENKKLPALTGYFVSVETIKTKSVDQERTDNEDDILQ